MVKSDATDPVDRNIGTTRTEPEFGTFVGVVTDGIVGAVGGLVGTALATVVLLVAATLVCAGATAALGWLLLVGYAALGLWQVRVYLPQRWEVWAAPLVGGVNGFLTGLTGSFVVPGVLYLQAIGLSRDQLVQYLADGCRPRSCRPGAFGHLRHALEARRKP